MESVEEEEKLAAEKEQLDSYIGVHAHSLTSRLILMLMLMIMLMLMLMLAICPTHTLHA